MPSPKIIKNATFEGARAGEAGYVRQPRRIVRQWVEEEDAAEREAGANEGFKLKGVLRSGQVREEVHPFTLTAFEQEPRAPLAPLPDEEEMPPPEENEPSPDQVEALRASWEAEWQARLEEEKAQAEAKGYEQGFAAAQQELQDAFEEQRRAVVEDAGRLAATWRDFLGECEPLLAILAFEVAEALLDAPLPSNLKGLSTRALTEALEDLAGETPIRIALHPVDFLQLQESGLAEGLADVHQGLVWEPDPDLQQGDWVAQSPVAAVRRLRDELAGTLKNRLASPAILQDHGAAS